MQRFRFTPRHPITRVAFTADGSGVITAQPHTAVTVRERTGETRRTFPTPKVASFHDLTVHPALGWFAVRTAKWTRLCDPADPRPYLCQMHAGCVGTAATTDGYRWYEQVTSDCFRHDFPEPATPHPPVTLRTRTVVELVGVTPGGRFGLAVRPRTRPVLVDLDTGRVAAEVGSGLRSRNMRLGQAVVTFSADGSKLALGSGDSLAVFDLSRVSADDVPADPDGTTEATKKRKDLYPLFTLDRPDPVAGRGNQADRTADHWLPSLAFDPDARTLLAVSLRNRVQRIDLATGGVLAEWNWRADAVRSLAVAPDGLTAAAGCRHGELVVWDLE